MGTAGTTHYVVTIRVERVDIDPREKRITSMGNNTATTENVRTITELANFTVKSNELQPLVEKVHQHMGLIDDIDATDPKMGKQR